MKEDLTCFRTTTFLVLQNNVSCKDIIIIFPTSKNESALNRALRLGLIVDDQSSFFIAPRLQQEIISSSTHGKDDVFYMGVGEMLERWVWIIFARNQDA